MKKELKLDFIGIGAPKCATSWIYECLKEHPEICMSQPKETYYFSEKKRSIRDYFSHCSQGQIKGEFSPRYLYREEVPRKIKSHNPQIKMIVSLRDPVERAHSNYLQGKTLQDKDWESFEEAIQKDSMIIERGFYYKYLSNFWEVFSKDQFLVMTFDKLKEDPEEFIQKIYKFLEVDDDFTPESLDIQVSPTKFRLTRLGKLTHKLIGQPLARYEWSKNFKKQSFVRKIYLKFAQFYTRNTKKPSIEEKTEERLKKLYQENISKLEQLIDKDLTHWKNDG